MDRQAWLELRRSALGGSDIAAVVGLSRWRGPLEVYCDKRGLIEPQADNEAMYWGRSLEENIAARYAEETGYTLIHGEWTTAIDEPWMGGTPDRLAVVTVEGVQVVTHGVEIKTARDDWGWGESGTDVIPDYYRAQVAWYQAVLDLDRWDVAVLFRGQEFRRYTIMRDAVLEAKLIAAGRVFWFDNVVAGVPPEPTHHSTETMMTLYPADRDAEILPSTAEVDETGWNLLRAKGVLSHAQQVVDGLESRVKAVIGDHAGVDGNGWRATWKRNKPTTKIGWEEVARNLAQVLGDRGVEVLERQISAHSTEKPGPRVLRIKERETR